MENLLTPSKSSIDLTSLLVFKIFAERYIQISSRFKKGVWQNPVRTGVFIILILALGSMGSFDLNAKEKILFFGAVSTANAITTITNDSNICVISPVFASSGTLAQQIAHGAPAEIFLSANEGWMDWLVKRDKIEPDSRIDVMGNRLVMITRKDNNENLVLDINLHIRLKESRLVIANPEHVPAGIYTKAALKNLGLWKSLVPKLARMQNVRSALRVVEQRGAKAGIVYATDVAASRYVKVASVIDTNTHQPIRYQMAITMGRKTPSVLACYEELLSSYAKSIFSKYGFLIR